MEDIKLICAWCQFVLREGSSPASHGICPLCQARVFADTDARYAEMTALRATGQKCEKEYQI